MARGFIRNPLDVRLLILYILDHLILPVTMAELTDLALCDDGVDYFQFATALGALRKDCCPSQRRDTITVPSVPTNCPSPCAPSATAAPNC